MNLASMLQERSPLRDRSETRTVQWWTSLVWPVTGLALLLLFNLAFTEGFFRVEIRDGRLYGVLIDILNHGSKVMLLSLGMALVIATGGVDLSVGAVMAITGAVAAQLINTEGVPFPVVIAASLCVALVAGAWNGLLVGAFNVQPIVATLILMVAGRGVAQLITAGQIITFTDPLLTYVGNGSSLGPAVSGSVELWPCSPSLFFLRARLPSDCSSKRLATISAPACTPVSTVRA